MFCVFVRVSRRALSHPPSQLEHFAVEHAHLVADRLLCLVWMQASGKVTRWVSSVSPLAELSRDAQRMESPNNQVSLVLTLTAASAVCKWVTQFKM